MSPLDAAVATRTDEERDGPLGGVVLAVGGGLGAAIFAYLVVLAHTAAWIAGVSWADAVTIPVEQPEGWGTGLDPNSALVGVPVSAERAAGLFLLEAQGVPTLVRPLGGGFEPALTAVGVTGSGAWTPLLVVVPVASLLLAGAVTARLGQASDPRGAALRGATVVVGYLPAVALLAWLVPATYGLPVGRSPGPVVVGPSLARAALVAAALGTALGALGGVVAATLDAPLGRDPDTDPERTRSDPD